MIVLTTFVPMSSELLLAHSVWFANQRPSSLFSNVLHMSHLWGLRACNPTRALLVIKHGNSPFIDEFPIETSLNYIAYSHILGFGIFNWFQLPCVIVRRQAILASLGSQVSRAQDIQIGFSRVLGIVTTDTRAPMGASDLPMQEKWPLFGSWSHHHPSFRKWNQFPPLQASPLKSCQGLFGRHMQACRTLFNKWTGAI